MTAHLKSQNSTETETVHGTSHETGIDFDFISDSLVVILQYLVFSIVCQAIVIFGTVSNIINIICFIKQGLQDSVNVSLLGLAISDIGCLITLIWANACYAPGLTESDLPFELLELQYIASAWPHIIFTRITSWITASITLERCLCITAPLKVKQIITPKRTTIFITCVFVILVASVIPVFAVNKLGIKFSYIRNTTLVGILDNINREGVEKVIFLFYNVLVPFTSFVIITVCTFILVIQLEKKAKWREKSTNSTQSDNVTKKNQKVAKMVVMISILFIACFVPLCVIFLAMSLEPRFTIRGAYRNTLKVVGGLSLSIESINSSSNIFIYYQMSSKYRQIFRQLFNLPASLTKDKITVTT